MDLREGRRIFVVFGVRTLEHTTCAIGMSLPHGPGGCNKLEAFWVTSATCHMTDDKRHSVSVKPIIAGQGDDR
jgi:hypothetical protein